MYWSPNTGKCFSIFFSDFTPVIKEELIFQIFCFVFIFSRWTKLKGGNVVRKPILDFEDGSHIKVEEKGNGRD